MATLDEASRCPKCDQPGDHSSSESRPDGSIVRTYYCRNERCRWYNTPWIVQVKADGTIPERKPQEKDYPDLTPGQEAMARRVIEDVVQEDLRAQ